MKLAYADPPYPGKAHLYPENTEVDHVALIARLCEFDGWALSTDEKNLRFVLALSPANARVMAWCRSNAPPYPPSPYAMWEPVIVRPARTIAPEPVRSYLVTGAPTGRAQVDGLTGQKTREFCLWVIRALAADPEDTLEDLFPGTGIMGATWDAWRGQLRLVQYVPENSRSYKERINGVRRTHDPLPGLEPAPYAKERRTPT